ncbi:hypothetical protein ACIQPR_25600 [Streptomyces sp. NPDC091280]|uniref:hypothetical protein n=1 Tax=Streptomyces sp. NPDC091280 TaxID=3365984 RepID=UPI0038103558
MAAHLCALFARDLARRTMAGRRRQGAHDTSEERTLAVVMFMRWTGVTPEQYDTVRDTVGWEEAAPAGSQVHVAWFDDEALNVTDVWDSEQAFQTFFAERLAPAVEKAGITGGPESDFRPLHRRFVTPGVVGGA